MNRMLVIVAVALAVVAGGIYWQTTQRPVTLEPVTEATTESAGVDTSSVIEMTIGAKDAKVTLIEYASFTCPHCATFHKGPFKQLKAEYLDNDQVHFIYRDVYFDRFGLAASLVARCGGKERFFGIADMLYTQQKQWIGDGDPDQIFASLRKIGKVAGLGGEQIDACLADDEKSKTLAAWYAQNSQADGINSTPTLVINGTKYSNMNYKDLKAIIDTELAK